MNYSYHYLDRATERTQFNEKSAVRFIQNGIDRGLTANQYKTTAERQYLIHQSRKGVTAKAYNGFCFIIDETLSTCITVYALPEWFGKHYFYDKKQRVRKAVKNYKMYEPCYPYSDC